MTKNPSLMSLAPSELAAATSRANTTGRRRLRARRARRASHAPTSLSVATLRRVDFDGAVYLARPGSDDERCLIGVRPHQAVLDASREGRPVLIARPRGGLPIVVALLDERLEVEAATHPTERNPRVIEPRVTLAATEVLELTCGEARLELRADGQVLVTSERLRASALGEVALVGAEIKLN